MFLVFFKKKERLNKHAQKLANNSLLTCKILDNNLDLQIVKVERNICQVVSLSLQLLFQFQSSDLHTFFWTTKTNTGINTSVRNSFHITCTKKKIKLLDFVYCIMGNFNEFKSQIPRLLKIYLQMHMNRQLRFCMLLICTQLKD